MNKKVLFLGMALLLTTTSVKAATVKDLSEWKEDNVDVSCTDGKAYNNCTLTLTGDAVQDIVIEDGKEITIDLGTHNLKGYTKGASVIDIKGTSEVTIKGTGTISASDKVVADAQKDPGSHDDKDKIDLITVASGATLTLGESTSDNVKISVPGINKISGIYNMGTLIVKNATITTAAVKTSTGIEGAWGITNTGSATIEDGTFTQGNAYSVISNAKTMTINGGTFNTSGEGIHNALITNNDVSNNQANLTIKEGNFKSFTNQKIISNSGADTTKIEGGKFEEGNVDASVASYKYMDKAVKLDGVIYAGSSVEEVATSAKSGDTVEVLKGDYGATLPSGVIVKNSGEGSVVVNNHQVTTEEYTIPTEASTPSTSTEEKEEVKDYTIVKDVKFTDNGEDIDIDGKIIKEENDTYKEMLTKANEKGYLTLYNMYDFYEKNNKTLTKPLEITFDLGVTNNGKIAYVLHQKHDNSYEEWEKTVENGKISITVSELSPFVVLLKDKEEEQIKDPVTNPETSSMNIVKTLGIAFASLGGLVILINKKRKDA